MQWQQKFLSTLLGLGLMGIVSSEAIANPASAYCLKQGGRLLTIKTPYGEAGYCLLSNKQVCEEWAFLSHKCPKPRAHFPQSAAVNAKTVTKSSPAIRKRSTKALKPVPFKSVTLADGYRTLPVTDVHVMRMANLAAQQLSHKQATVQTIVWAQRKKGSGQNYRMLITLTDGKQYSALVYQAPGKHPPLLREAKLLKPLH